MALLPLEKAENLPAPIWGLEGVLMPVKYRAYQLSLVIHLLDTFPATMVSSILS